ncbi:MAG: hypothetical protein RI894_1249 [Bacteroidota bacterium]|jgi:rubrerythrin
MIEDFKTLLIKCRTRMGKLMEQMERAGVGSKGDYQNEIDKELANIKFYEEQIAQLEKAQTPDQINILFYVIVSTKEAVKQNIGEACFDCLEHDRYHDTKAEGWKPFAKSEPILTILQRFQTKYPFNPQYLDGEISDNVHIEIDAAIENCIAIIDVLSINDTNKHTALKFDTRKAGLIMPFCQKLYQFPLINDFKDNVNLNYKTLNASINQNVPCGLYFTDITGIQSFQQHLNFIFTTKFPIKNQSTEPSSVRALSMSFQ